jgi:hypothetical protein
MERSRPAAAILWGGFVGGTLDITFAAIRSVQLGGTVGRMLQGIAAGLLGRGVVGRGWGYALLGLGLHFFIALSAATTYYVAGRRIRILVDSPWLCGPVFGALWYFMMNRVVLPLSALHFSPPFAIPGFLAVTLLIGLPVSLATRHFSRPAGN